MFYISDDQFYFLNGNAKDFAEFYECHYSNFDKKRFSLNENRKTKTFSKGKKKRLSLLVGVCTNIKYLLCDETFGDIDPVMRQGIKSIFTQKIEEWGVTPIIAKNQPN